MWILLLASVYLNGVNIDGLRGQKFEKCKAVRIDDRGDVYLECAGYQVEQPAAAAPAPAPLIPSALAAAMTKRYWLVSEEKTIKGSYMGSCVPVRDIPRFIALYQQGKLPVDRMMSQRIGFDQLNEGFDRLQDVATVRQVLVPHGA